MWDSDQAVLWACSYTYIYIERDVRSNMATASSRNTEPSTCVHELYRSFCVSVMGCALFVHLDVDTDTF